MRKVVSTHLFLNERLHPGILDRLQDAGVEAVELFCDRRSFDYTDPAQVDLLASWFRQNPMQLHSLHSPMYRDASGGRSGEPPINIADPQARIRLEALEEIQRALDLADKIPFHFLIQHLGVGNEEGNQRKADAAFTSLERLRLLARQVGVSVLVENIPNGLSMPEDLLQFLHETHLQDVGICFDSGHAQMGPAWFGGGGAAAVWDLMQPRIRSTHLHDNHGGKDEHLWPGQGTIAWNELMPRLAAHPDVAWVLEIAGTERENAASVCTRIRQTFEQMERWSQSPE